MREAGLRKRWLAVNESLINKLLVEGRKVQIINFVLLSLFPLCLLGFSLFYFTECYLWIKFKIGDVNGCCREELAVWRKAKNLLQGKYKLF